MPKSWKAKLREFLRAEGDFAAKDLADFGLTPFEDDVEHRQEDLRRMQDDMKTFIQRVQHYWDRFSSPNEPTDRSSKDQ